MPFSLQLTQLTSFEGIDDSKQITVLSYHQFLFEMETFFKKKITT